MTWMNLFLIDGIFAEAMANISAGNVFETSKARRCTVSTVKNVQCGYGVPKKNVGRLYGVPDSQGYLCRAIRVSPVLEICWPRVLELEGSILTDF